MPSLLNNASLGLKYKPDNQAGTNAAEHITRKKPLRGSSMQTALHHFFKNALFLALLSFGTSVTAESSKEFGDYVIHYNAFRSDTLTPEVAKTYNLQRRNNRLIVNIAVQA